MRLILPVCICRIWEKKYGKGAKHLQKSAEAESLAKAAVDAKKVSRTSKAKQRAEAFSREYDEEQQLSQQRGPRNHHPARESHQHQQQQQHPSRPHDDSRGQKRGRPAEDAEDEASLHPSWKARKMASEKASLGVAGGGFSGTKITFD